MTNLPQEGPPISMSQPATKKSFDTLNLLRGLVALTVLGWHFKPIYGPHYWSAYLSVDLFFVISGVVVAYAYEDRLLSGWSARRFMIARMIRLWPLYLLGTAIGAVAMFASIAVDGLRPWNFRHLALDTVLAVPLLPRISPIGESVFPLNPPAWSLFCELVVNLGYGLIGYRLSNRALAAIAACGALVLSWGAFQYSNADVGLNLGGLAIHLPVGLGRAAFAFPVGVLLFRAWRSGSLPQLRIPPAMLAIGFLLLLFIVPGEGSHAPLASILAVCIACPLLVMAAIHVEPRGPLRTIARLTADLSYPIYATHDALFLGAAFVVAHGAAAPIPAYGVALLAALVAAPLADHFWDRPVRGFLTRHVHMPTRVADAAPPL